MKVRMRVRISGTHDGVDWPQVGEVADLSDIEADDLIRAGLAVDMQTATAEPGETATVMTRAETADAPAARTEARKRKSRG